MLNESFEHQLSTVFLPSVQMQLLYLERMMTQRSRSQLQKLSHGISAPVGKVDDCKAEVGLRVEGNFFFVTFSFYLQASGISIVLSGKVSPLSCSQSGPCNHKVLLCT